jgi:tetraacyldisaccharide 4'-kinase
MPQTTRDRRPLIERLWEPTLPITDLAMWLPLAPAAAAYRAGVAMRNLYWRAMSRGTSVLTVSVGNLIVGGSGKTPFTLFLARRLQALGLKAGIASRGWARKRAARHGALLVADGGELRCSADEAGDEPAMMAKSFSGPIAVAQRRINAIDLLKRECGVDVVVLDDAFQHLRLRRDVNLLLVNAERGFGNGWLLPAGPMREPLGAARRADAVILVSSGGESALSQKQLRALTGRPALNASIRPRALVSPGDWRESRPMLAGRRVLAVSAIADPTAFHAMLGELEGELVDTLQYPDHYPYTRGDWQGIVAAARNADLVVTTEKDLIKLERFPFARDSLYALRVEVSMSDADARALDELIVGRRPSLTEAVRA